MIGQIYIGPMLQQNLHYFFMATPGRRPQSCSILRINAVQLASMLN